MARPTTDSHDEPTPSPSANTEDVFADEYALDAEEDDFMPIADGFRPTSVSERTAADPELQHDHTASQPPSTPTEQVTDDDIGSVSSQSGAIKAPYRLRSPSPDSGHPDPHHNRTASAQAAEALRRHVSITSTTSFATSSDSPFNSGPSHPYAMYPQNPVGRSSSVTTSSAQRPIHQLPSLSGPTHPYGMYPQNVVEEDALPPVQSTIPLGFPGLNTGYHRRIGPDGEEQDIIGPDGHTEQLPPYTRYPEEGPTKAALAAEASATPIVAPVPAPVAAPAAVLDSAAVTTPSSPELPPSPVSPVAPLSPVQALPPQAQEPQNAGAPLRPANVEAATTPAASLSATDSGFPEKQEIGKGATPWRKKRLWGRVPMVVAIAVLFLLLIFAAILGAAIGTFIAKARNRGGSYGSKGRDYDEPSPQVTGTISLFDATPIPTPTSLSPIPTGTFALPLGIAQESSKNCLTVANQLSAWSCKLTFAPLVLTINSTDRTGQSIRPMASIAPFPGPDKSIQYGIQPPSIARTPMQLVSDLDFKVYGPAYHFASMYDKIVVLGQNDFAAGAALVTPQRRDDKAQFRHRFEVQPGDTPWFCYWNSTYLEGYIYVEDNSTAATVTNYPTAWPPIPSGSSLPLETAPATASDQAPSSPPPPSQATPLPASAPPRRRDDVPYPRYTPYPRIVKIEERRLPGSPKPYCQQMRLLENLTLVPVVDDAQDPIRIYLSEEDPSLQEFMDPDSPSPSPTATSVSGQPRRRNLVSLEKRGDPPQACHCQWMFQ
ncbi:uncharacterized protein EI97DRAFT_391313 [Westerdykella ornata]|uniref:DUF7820 domain-containing protein n=1 Tax=Westerdykella ornata TaxID=318751 RepID=A0A6A6JX37_WESOR|nr:uncharacterized protein EI97DRAFT_391313 [Westerdykella ornata]KAF2280296.1 hypothetical protein EI97DRAFT_391313 [Westerdykella ornata]